MSELLDSYEITSTAAEESLSLNVGNNAHLLSSSNTNSNQHFSVSSTFLSQQKSLAEDQQSAEYFKANGGAGVGSGADSQQFNLVSAAAATNSKINQAVKLQKQTNNFTRS